MSGLRSAAGPGHCSRRRRDPTDRPGAREGRARAKGGAYEGPWADLVSTRSTSSDSPSGAERAAQPLDWLLELPDLADFGGEPSPRGASPQGRRHLCTPWWTPLAYCQRGPAVHGAGLSWRRRCDDSCLFRNGGTPGEGRKPVSPLAWRANCRGAPGPAGGKLSRDAARGLRFRVIAVTRAVIVTDSSPRSRNQTGLTVGMAPQRTSRICEQSPWCCSGAQNDHRLRHPGVQRRAAPKRAR